jgi:predicted enzyme related to lactoylglutathione lyase
MSANNDENSGPPDLFRPGSITYIQIPAVDADALADFYEAVFGWNVRQRGSPHVGFDDANGHVSGAFITHHAPSRDSGILPYIYVGGIDAAVERVKLNGGEIVRAPYPEGDLWVATFRDPAGNVVGMWQHGER